MTYKSSTTCRLRYAGNSEWLKLHNHKLNGDYPVLMTRIPDCPNFHLMYPGCDRDKDNIFQCININLSKGENKMSVLTESRGWTTHFHCLLGLVFCLIGAYALLAVEDIKVAGVCLFAVLANILCAQGCTRQKLQKLGNT